MSSRALVFVRVGRVGRVEGPIAIAIDQAGARPISVGGDHSITGGIVQAIGCGNITGGEPVCFLHLDAHTDVFTKVDHFLGAKKSTDCYRNSLAANNQK